MFKLYQTKRFEVFSFLSGMALGLALILSEHAGAVTSYPPGSLLQPNDVTSSHIRNNTITGADVSTSAAFTLASSTISTLMSGVFTATSSATLPATTTINGVAYKFTNTQGATSTNLQNDGAGNLSWVSGGTTQLTTTYTAGEALNANDLVFIRNTPVALNHGTAVGVANQYTPISVAVNATTNSNRLLLMQVVSINSQPLGSLACTYNGVAMTQTDTKTVGNNFVHIFGLVAPASGSNTLACSWTGGFQAAAHIIPFYEAEQTLSFSATAYATSTGTALSSSITTTEVNQWVASFLTIQSGAVTSGTNCTVLVSQANTGGACDSGNLTTTGSKSLTATGGTNGSNPWSMYSIAIKQYRQTHDDVWKASASTGATASSTIGFALTSYATNTLATIVTQGVVTGFTGLTLAGQYYLGNASGTASTTPGTVTRKMGIGLSTTTMLITNSW